MIVNALKCFLCGDIVYSRARHDARHCSCGNCYIDGGFDYQRCGAKRIDKIKDVKFLTNITKKEFYDDWNLKRDKYGLIKDEFNKEIVESINSGKPEPVFKEETKLDKHGWS